MTQQEFNQALQNFINTYTGIPCGNTPENKGECVGLEALWCDVFSLPHIWGNAKDLLTNADPNAYEVIYNTPTNFPIAGDIFVCGATWGGGKGHTGAITIADVNSWTAFEQNNPEGHTPQILTHNTYAGMLGWIRFKNIITTDPVPVTPQLEGLSVDVGYNPTFEGQDVMKDGLHYKSIKDSNGILIWKIEQPEEVTPTIISIPVSTTAGTSAVEIPVETTASPEKNSSPVAITSTPPLTVLQTPQSLEKPPTRQNYAWIKRILDWINSIKTYIIVRKK